MTKLKEYLENVPPGAVHEADGLDHLLADRWDAFQGASEGGMEGYKLVGRMESVSWQPPILTFVIERHGATVCGSTRAELQHWEVDLDRMTTNLIKTGRRQREPMAERMPIKAMAQELAELILGGNEDDRLEWKEDGSVRVLASDIFPTGSAFKRTIEGRRKRLCDLIGDILVEQGWKKIGGNRFRKDQAPNHTTPIQLL